MNDSSNTTAELDQADEQILTFAVSDEALEAAAGTKADVSTNGAIRTAPLPNCC